MWTGVMLGAVLFGGYSDEFGRAKAVCLAICANIGTGIILTLAPSQAFFVIMLFLQGSTLSGLLMATFVLAVEHVGMRDILVKTKYHLFMSSQSL